MLLQIHILSFLHETNSFRLSPVSLYFISLNRILCSSHQDSFLYTNFFRIHYSSILKIFLEENNLNPMGSLHSHAKSREICACATNQAYLSMSLSSHPRHFLSIVWREDERLLKVGTMSLSFGHERQKRAYCQVSSSYIQWPVVRRMAVAWTVCYIGLALKCKCVIWFQCDDQK